MLYNILLPLHNIVRWVVIILGIVAFGLSLSGWLGKRPWTEQVRKFGAYFGMSADVQLLLGILLLFTSPLVRTAYGNLSSAPGDSVFFAVIHPIMMFLGIIFAHLGSVLARRVEEPRAKYIRGTIFFGLAVIFILMAVPWQRPLLRI
jgi:hypothetical protein